MFRPLGITLIQCYCFGFAFDTNPIDFPHVFKISQASEREIAHQNWRAVIRRDAFNARGEVYGIAELVRRQRGGTAVVLGALSPRTPYPSERSVYR